MSKLLWNSHRLKSSDPGKRALAAENLGRYRTVEVIIALTKASRDPDVSVATAAQDSLKTIRDSLINELLNEKQMDLEYLKTKFKYFNDTETRDLLAASLEDKEYVPEKRACAAYILGSFWDRRGLTYLAECLVDKTLDDGTAMFVGFLLEKLGVSGAMRATLKERGLQGILNWVDSQAAPSAPSPALRLCSLCRKGEAMSKCTRCQRLFCEECLNAFSSYAARVLIDRVAGKIEGPTFGTAKTFDAQGRAFCPECYGNVLTKAQKTGNWTIENKSEIEPSCLRLS
jgi:hypothetical protein